LQPLSQREAWSAGILALLSLLIGILPGILVAALDGSTRIMAQF
jgi:NADH-quinone oxidoreductase subunit M